MLAHGRPEVPPLKVGMLGLLDDQLFRHDLAQHQLILGGAGRCGGALGELREHLPDLLVSSARTSNMSSLPLPLLLACPPRGGVAAHFPWQQGLTAAGLVWCACLYRETRGHSLRDISTWRSRT